MKGILKSFILDFNFALELDMSTFDDVFFDAYRGERKALFRRTPSDMKIRFAGSTRDQTLELSLLNKDVPKDCFYFATGVL
ncbi:hypothetical protein V1477_018376 [Vespula maculifrons]|uniref:Uncharacterized protein n=1 Tax=Vespula maculifrons TaxID=7453 RepID=A0ABD2AZ98_VESMC